MISCQERMSNILIFLDIAEKHIRLYPYWGLHNKYRSMQKVINRYKLENIWH